VRNYKTACAFCSLLLFVCSGVALAQSNGALSLADFGMQCGTSTAQTTSQNCQPVSNQITLPTEPGLLRLWDSQVQWSDINPVQNGAYIWTTLNQYLYAIASDPTSPAVIYTFGDVPCWDVAGSCTGSGTLPKDIGTGACGKGSCAFDSFVTALMNHCAPKTTQFPNGVCVKNVIRYFEMWNEFDNHNFWTGTVTQLYNMAASAAKVIATNGLQPPNQPIILTPSVTETGESSMLSWVQTEAANTIISNYYNFHAYLNTSSPESIWLNYVQQNLSPSGHGLLYPNYNGPSPWKPLPWLVSETNFDPQINGQGQLTGYSCVGFTSADCIGQMVRWQVLLNANGWSAPSGTVGASNVSWYWWKATIGDVGSGTQYATPYSYMQQYLNGGSFPQSCAISGSSSAATITCLFNEQGGTAAEWVWTNTESGLNYTVPSGYVDYRTITASGKTCVTANQLITITVEPILLEKGTSCP
jgi:hypothetical protein